MKNQKVAIVVDSTAYIPPDLVDKHHIQVIPQILTWEGKSYLDDIDISPTEFYERLTTAKEMPSSSQPTPAQFFEFFSNVANKAESIVGVFISEELSGTLDSAYSAANMMPDYPIEIIDSRSTSLGLGFLALVGARAAEDGKSSEEVANIVRTHIESTRVVFVVDTLEFLHRGGRIGGAQRLLGSMLSVKPLLHIQDGRIEPLESTRTKKKAIQGLLDRFENETRNKEGIHVAVIHANNPKEGQFLFEKVTSCISPVELFLAELSPVIGTHVGPGTVGLSYYAES